MVFFFLLLMASNGLFFPTPHGRLCFSPLFLSWMVLVLFFLFIMAGNGPLFPSHHGRLCFSPFFSSWQVKKWSTCFFLSGQTVGLSFFSSWQVGFLSFLFNMAGIVVLSFLLVVAVFFSPNQKAYLSFLTLLLWEVLWDPSSNMTNACHVPLSPYHHITYSI